MKVIKNEKIKNITTYKLEGNVKKIIIPENVEELKEVIKNEKKYKIIGKGSNLIISSSYDGALIKLNKLDNIKIDKNKVTVGAGYNLPKLSIILAKKNLKGLEFLSGVPGTIGGAIYMNAGAYGKEIKDIVESVKILDQNGKIKKLKKEQLNFSYRSSIFKEKSYICLEANLILEYGNEEDIIEEIKEKMKKRKETQPLEYPSAGSVFKNPKDTSAGRLIEKIGLKGLKIGGAEVSKKHANFIINKGNATAEDVEKLIEIIKKKVKEKENVELICEQEIIKGWKNG